MGCGGSKEEAELLQKIDRRLHDGAHVETLRLLNTLFGHSLVPKCWSAWIRFVDILKDERAEIDKINEHIATKQARMGEHVQKEAFKSTFVGFRSRKTGFGEKPVKSNVHRSARLSESAENEQMMSSIKSKLKEREARIQANAGRGWSAVREYVKSSNSIAKAGRKAQMLGASPPRRKQSIFSSRVRSRMSVFSKIGMDTELDEQSDGPDTPPQSVGQEQEHSTPFSPSIAKVGRKAQLVGASPPRRKQSMFQGRRKSQMVGASPPRRKQSMFQSQVLSRMSVFSKISMDTELDEQSDGPDTPPQSVGQEQEHSTPFSPSIAKVGRKAQLVGASPPRRKQSMFQGRRKSQMVGASPPRRKQSMFQSQVLSRMSVFSKISMDTELDEQSMNAALPNGPGMPPQPVVQQQEHSTPSSTGAALFPMPSPGALPPPGDQILRPPDALAERQRCSVRDASSCRVANSQDVARAELSRASSTDAAPECTSDQDGSFGSSAAPSAGSFSREMKLAGTDGRRKHGHSRQANRPPGLKRTGNSSSGNMSTLRDRLDSQRAQRAKGTPV